MSRRLALIATAVALIAAAAVVFLVVTLPDPNHVSAVSAVQHAGIQPGVTPGPTWEKP
jgi:hypothetical protein